MKLPLELRGEGRYRKLNLGIDCPNWFYDGIKAIDPHLYFVWHPFKVLYEDIMNNYSGGTEEARYTIGVQEKYGNELIFGYVLTDGAKRPLPDNRWHLWRLCKDRGWAHVAALEATSDEHYLKFVLDQMYVRDQVLTKYGAKGLTKFIREEQELFEEKKKTASANLFADINKENKRLFRSAYENFLNGKIEATNPTKDVIASFAGQKSHNRITRPITDEEGGLITS